MAALNQKHTLLILILLFISPAIAFHSIIQLPRDSSADDTLYCGSWKFSVETNDAGSWITVPARCKGFVADYFTGERYRSDSDIVADYSLVFAKTVKIADDRKDAWVFDIDETLLSNTPYYEAHEYGSEPFNEASFNEWVNLASAPALDASQRLYNELKELGFTIFLLTGRDETERSATEKNLLFSGYTGWERLILRGQSDKGKTATSYKSEKRSELVTEGYRIHGNSGDQWSDLQGYAVATRSFKLPNPLYYIP